MEYVYITFKKEDHFFVNERELDIMANFMNLERTYGRDQISKLFFLFHCKILILLY